MSTRRQIALALNLNKEFDRQIATGVARFAREAGWSVYIEEDPANRLPSKNAWRGDGLIADLDDPSVVKAVARMKLPVVGVGGAIEKSRHTRWHYVATDNLAIAKLAAEHLMRCGLRSFGFCGIPSDVCAAWAGQRESKFREILSEHGYRTSVFRGRHRKTTDWEGLQSELVSWVESLTKPVGIMACDDPRAKHLLEACRRASLRVPEEVAIIGVDNDSLLCELSNPPLSSVAQGTAMIGYQAATILEQLIKGKKFKENFHLIPPTGIVARQSTDIDHQSNPIVFKALLFLREHLAEPLSVSTVARAVGRSRGMLDHDFNAAIGRTVHAELERLRMERACALLTTTDLPLKTIAPRCGYRTLEYFVTAFRKTMGATPGDFRRHASRPA